MKDTRDWCTSGMPNLQFLATTDSETSVETVEFFFDAIFALLAAGIVLWFGSAIIGMTI